MSIAAGNITVNNIYKGSEDVNKIYQGSSIIYEKHLDDKFDYFHVYATGGPAGETGYILFTQGEGKYNATVELEYSRDGLNWSPFNTGDENRLSLNINYDENTGDPIYDYIFIRGNNSGGFSGKGENDSSWGHNSLYICDTTQDKNANITIAGNIMSLIYGNNFVGKNTIPATSTQSGCFEKLFTENSRYDTRYSDIYDARDLKLPATVLKHFCYCDMFVNCKNLRYAPKVLPANNLYPYCYAGMFAGCENLLSAPALPAENIDGHGCYYGMFSGCTSLINAPVLTGKNINLGCYEKMFKGCSSLTLLKIYAETIDSGLALQNWLQDINTQGTLIKKKSLDFDFTYNVPEGWTIEEID